jgi:hypothetical protein
MTPQVQVGTILIEDRPLMTRALDIESEPYAGNWSLVRSLNGFDLDRKIHAAGWNFFFMAGEARARFLGRVEAGKVRKALMRILARTSDQNFNCLEVTGITAHYFLGGAIHEHISAPASYPAGLPASNDVEQRRTQQKAAEWARA